MSILTSLRALVTGRAGRRTVHGDAGPDDPLAPPAAGVRTYSQRVSPPYCGQVQIAESARARALTMDGVRWEVQSIHASVVQVAPGVRRVERQFRHLDALSHASIQRIAAGGELDGQPVDERVVELASHIGAAALPFTPNDDYEYWLLDAKDGSPLAYLFSCADPAEMRSLPVRPAWTALPETVMPIDKTDHERAEQLPPVNYRLECLVADRAGPSPKARWFRRSAGELKGFPPLLVREDWQTEREHDLCQRYLQRQAARLLMLHDLAHEVRVRLERAVRPNVDELARFHALYPAVTDPELLTAMRVEARLRDAGGEQSTEGKW